jgi:hypothetical protein
MVDLVSLAATTTVYVPLDHLQRILAVVFLSISIVAYLVWAIDYTIQVPWWKNMLGRHQVIASGIVELFLITQLILLATPYYRPVTDWAMITAGALMAFMMCWRITIWRRLDKDAHILAHKDDDKHVEETRIEKTVIETTRIEKSGTVPDEISD